MSALDRFCDALTAAGCTVHLGPGRAVRVYAGEDGERRDELDAIAEECGYELHRGPSDDYYLPCDDAEDAS